MKTGDPIVFVIDDDPSMREALADLIASVGLLSVESFKSAPEFLARRRPDAPACLVLDVRLPGFSGLDLQRELLRTEAPIPIIFITGHGDIPMSIRA
jgi:FixJ family two-component response regulator